MEGADDAVTARGALIDEIRQALRSKAMEVSESRRPSGRELALTLADEISGHLRDRMPWSAISEVFCAKGVSVSTATLKGYHQQALRQRRGGAAVARGGREKRVQAPQSERPGGVVQAPVMAPVGPVRATSGHRRIMSEDC